MDVGARVVAVGMAKRREVFGKFDVLVLDVTRRVDGYNAQSVFAIGRGVFFEGLGLRTVNIGGVFGDEDKGLVAELAHVGVVVVA